METKDLLLIILPILSAILSSYFTYYLSLRGKKAESIMKFKEEKYANLIILLQGFVGSTTSGETKRKFFEEQYKSWMYASDEVVQSVNHLVQLVIDAKGATPNPEVGRKSVGDIILAMRKDLLGKTNLTYKDFGYTDVVSDK